MTAVSSAGKNYDERLVGLLHDLVEDKETPYMDYIRNICESGNKVALAVKINDLNHNLKRGRAGGHWQHVAKHEEALAHLYCNNRLGISYS